MVTPADFGLTSAMVQANQRNSARLERWRNDGLTRDTVTVVLFFPLTFLVVAGQRERAERWCAERSLAPDLVDDNWTLC